ncbi:bifunctional adenosylcobinamide kinase/adenosylcobinamide-phosphate guanylyltransferase [Thermosediminibacter litoriperuensis]|uniref:Adenosylcobinamide kinase n=1 Tax=Thermosediminibacter litoriperuensis TaxID=291989 RepID=A0A5S5AV68_9FIRM|nr:bifunctional adenosylcobinamide kinase/adenosylcobinamide-phosphate guanylyltransferase [Thermosediminibacter litoriperuensis]TYP56793.1 adenosylcobinamide kinase /adenosylcobinamide-phosphate guanylyltransferase [Thermosediminibacter litoriperuensis]
MGIVFITGGARSGKSRFAEKKAREAGNRVVYIATAQALDEEMAHRISVHRQRRPGTWKTIEEPRHLSRVLNEISKDADISEYDAVLIDCMALLTSNWVCSAEIGEIKQQEALRKALLQEIENTISAARVLEKKVIIVSNEVGLGLVPEYPLGRIYRDLLGEINQILAAAADEVYFLVSGIPIKLK